MQPKAKQMSEQFKNGDVAGVVVRELRKFTDRRGWLVELFRQDELSKGFYPVMAYLSSSKPGVIRGPHEHVEQADLFCFIGPSNFKVRMWDRRPDSETFQNVLTLIAGEDQPKSIVIPPGVVHAYQNVGSINGFVINCPNRLYMGDGRQHTIDEIRYEDDPKTVFRIND